MLQVKDGGTGAPTAAGARVNLGLGPDSSVTFTNLTLSGNLTVGGTITGGAVSFSSIVVPDNGLSITGSSDATKILKFEVDGFTTATTRTITVPNVTDTMVTLAATQTLTNKTIGVSQLSGQVSVANGGTGVATITGLVSGNGTSNFVGRTITGTANEITVTNGSGATANPTLSLPTALTFTGKTVTGGTFNIGTLTATKVTSGSGTQTTVTSVDQLVAINTSGNAGLLIESSNTGNGYLTFGDGAVSGRVEYNHSTNEMRFMTAGTEAFSLTATGNAMLTSTDAGAGLAPNFETFRDSASPSVGDLLGAVDFQGRNNSGTKIRYGIIVPEIVTSAAGSESSRLYLQIRNAGAAQNIIMMEPDYVEVRGNFTALGALAATNTATTRSNLGLAIGSNVQAWDADLDAISASSGTGIHARTGSATWALRTITGTANQIDVTNGDGVSGSPVLSLPVGAVMSATYSPTASTFTNVDSVSSITGMYLRVGSFVTVAGVLVIDATAVGVASFELTLPFGSDFTTGVQASGTFSSQGGVSGRITSSAANNRAVFTHTATSAAGTTYSYHFTYQLI